MQVNIWKHQQQFSFQAKSHAVCDSTASAFKKLSLKTVPLPKKKGTCPTHSEKGEQEPPDILYSVSSLKRKLIYFPTESDSFQWMVNWTCTC